MSLIKMTMTCINEDCESTIHFEAEFDSGDVGSRECPPTPASMTVGEEVICHNCKTDNTEKAQEVADDYQFPDEDRPDYDESQDYD
jgi:hypothetical protein